MAAKKIGAECAWASTHTTAARVHGPASQIAPQSVPAV